MNSIPRVIAVLQESAQVLHYLEQCRLIVTMMTGNPNLPNPPLSLPQVSAHLDTLDASQKLVGKGGKDAVAQRDVALTAVRIDMRLLKAYVQGEADKNLNEAASIIKSAGFDIGKARARNKPPVGAKHGQLPGRVVLECKAVPQPAQYRWQMSTDQKTWTDLPETFKAKTIVDGLTPATVYYFRLRTFTHGGLSDGSTVVSLIAH